MIYLNYAAVDPGADQREVQLLAFPLGRQLRHQDGGADQLHEDAHNIKKVYLINQDYSFGHAVRDAAKEMLAEKRPDIQIVGDELHPLLKITDFAPYIAKIKASGADTVITGNWGRLTCRCS